MLFVFCSYVQYWYDLYAIGVSPKISHTSHFQLQLFPQRPLTMRFSFATLALSLIAAPATAVLYGDEGYSHLDGKFYAFYSGGVAVIDPVTCKIDSTITEDSEGEPLPGGWSDGIYMQYYAEEQRRLDHGAGAIKGYVLINSRINRDNDLGDTVSDVYVFNTKERKVEAIVEVGSRVVHSYGVHNR